MRNTTLACLFPILLCLFILPDATAQQVTGVWKGRIDHKRVELKIVQKGDSLTGTSYYYEAGGSYRRYSIKGYFDAFDNSVVWWDDQLLEDKGSRGFLGMGGTSPLLSVADFNCPGGGEMFLEGAAGPAEDPDNKKGPVDLTKVDRTTFPDEWDYVLGNYTVGANNPEIIDSIALIAAKPEIRKPEQPVRREREEEAVPELPARKPGMVVIAAPPVPQPEPQSPIQPVTRQDSIATVVREEPPAVPTPTIVEKFKTRDKEIAVEIPVTGDSIELRFYDNAEVDGDSISLFLNDRLLFQHIRLTDRAYTIKLPVHELAAFNDLTMVAENLGSIPPNTSYMVAIVGDKRYEARLASTENSSAVVRLRKDE